MSPSAQTLKTPRQQSLPLPVKLTSKYSTRGISASSLRPGMWLRLGGFYRGGDNEVQVVQNSSALRRVEVAWWSDGTHHTFDWDNITPATYLGQGRRRWWWPLLPEIARKYISAFSRP